MLSLFRYAIVLFGSCASRRKLFHESVLKECDENAKGKKTFRTNSVKRHQAMIIDSSGLKVSNAWRKVISTCLDGNGICEQMIRKRIPKQRRAYRAMIECEESGNMDVKGTNNE